MSSQQIPSSLRDIFADTLEISSDEVTPELSMESAETWDSFVLRDMDKRKTV